SCVVGSQFDSSSEFLLCTSPVPCIFEAQRQRCVSLGQKIVDFKGPHCVLFCFLRCGKSGISSTYCQHEIRVCNSGIGQGIPWINVNCLLETLYRLLQTALSPSVPMIPSLKIEIVGVNISRLPVRNDGSFSPNKFDCEIIRESLRI